MCVCEQQERLVILLMNQWRDQSRERERPNIIIIIIILLLAYTIHNSSKRERERERERWDGMEEIHFRRAAVWPDDTRTHAHTHTHTLISGRSLARIHLSFFLSFLREKEKRANYQSQRRTANSHFKRQKLGRNPIGISCFVQGTVGGWVGGSSQGPMTDVTSSVRLHMTWPRVESSRVERVTTAKAKPKSQLLLLLLLLPFLTF